MNHELARSFFMDYLYDEIEQEDKQRLENYLEKHPALRQELEELQETRTLLRQMPLAEPGRQLMMMEPRERSFSRWLGQAKNLLPQSGFGKLGLAAAAGLILLLFAGSAARLHIDVADTGFSVSMGYNPVVNEGLTARQAQALLDQIREENTALMTEYARTIQQENQQQLQQVVRYVQQQRINDLQLIDQNLDQLQQTHNYRWLQTNRFLGEMLQNVNFQEQN